MKNIIEKLKNTKVNNAKSNHLLGEIIRKEFDATKNENRAFELLELAYNMQLLEFEEMLNDYSLTDFDWF